MSSSIVVQQSGQNMLIRVLWFFFLGFWLGGIISAIAWLLSCTIIGLPLALWLINRLPSIMTLRPQEAEWRLEGNVLKRGKIQRSFWARALYFLFVGWWLSAIWLIIAYLATISLVLLPVGFIMYGRVGAVTTLYRS